MTTTTISESVTSTTGIFGFSEDNERVIVAEGVVLSTTESVLFAYYDVTNLQAEIYGTLAGWIGVQAPETLSLSIGANGQVNGRYAGFYAGGDSGVVNDGILTGQLGIEFYDLVAGGSNAVENRGTILGEEVAVRFTGFGDVATLVNHGLIKTQDDSPGRHSHDHAVVAYRPTTTVVNDGEIVATSRSSIGVLAAGNEDPTANYRFLLDNSGTIRSERHSAVEVWQGTASTIVNTGDLIGTKVGLRLSYKADSVRNDGSIVGRVELGAGDDSYHGGKGHVTREVWGQGGDDILSGGGSVDKFGGGSGDDTLTGGGGDDILIGGAGADILSGGRGEDTFRFLMVSDATGDRIVASDGVSAFQGAGSAGGDLIDLSVADANEEIIGDQTFSFGTTRGVGDLWAVDVGNVTHIRGNTGGDETPEFDLAIHDGAGIRASDYAAVDFILDPVW